MPNNPPIPTAVNQVTLQVYNSSYLTQIEQYHLTEEQLQFTGFPLPAIEKSMTSLEFFPIMILQQDVVVGFFVLHGWEGVQMYHNNEDALLLRTYSIAHSHQGKGFATQSLQLLPSFVKQQYPSKNEVILAVNVANKAAQHVYLKSGFVDKGIRTMGSHGMLMIMHMKLFR
ncbi:GNAT family N-acetyltransferase [Paenibacillus sp. N1-5-1-14]|uniref:GNAT family N-acetyltransferase n=1 Tax=Paenibacillus radicibacter TaxID=2972488 RepID=UPI002158D920|nr:GNAT family N-acetyltransferase [Paenibacillus radicibacter]MCR8643429.1 GNAT family N-acetyltransferase [Paenibacillus radicibacter]